MNFVVILTDLSSISSFGNQTLTDKLLRPPRARLLSRALGDKIVR